MQLINDTNHKYQAFPQPFAQDPGCAAAVFAAVFVILISPTVTVHATSQATEDRKIEYFTVRRVNIGGPISVYSCGKYTCGCGYTHNFAMVNFKANDMDIVDYYDLEPLIGGEYLTGHCSNDGNGIWYFGTNAGFVVYNIDGHGITPLAHYVWESRLLDEIIRGMAATPDGYLYLACGDTGLFVFDLRDRANPVLRMIYRASESSFEDVVYYN